MIVPMEIIAQMANNRALSELAPRQRGSNDFSGTNQQFDSIFGQVQANRPAQPERSRPDHDARASDTSNGNDRHADDCQAVDRPQDESEAALAQYDVAGNKENVAVILEGDRKSGTLAEHMILLALDNEGDDAELQKLLAQAKAQAEQKETVKIAEPEITAQNVKDAHLKVKAETQSLEIVKDSGVIEGEVAARMPETKTSARDDLSKENAQSKSAGSGDLSHLENESDATRIKDSKETNQTGKENAAQSEERGGGENQFASVNFTDALKAESLRAEQQTKQAQQAVTPENLFEELVSKLDSMNSEGRQTMTIELKPEFLGKLGLQLTIDAAGLHVRIDASDPGIRSLVSGQINTLIQQLELRGLEVVEVEVTHTGIDNGNFNSSNRGYAYSNKSGSAYADRLEDKAAIYATAIELHEYYLEMGVSSVEYRA